MKNFTFSHVLLGGISMIGDNQPLEQKRTYFPWLIGLGTISLLGMVYYWKRK